MKIYYSSQLPSDDAAEWEETFFDTDPLSSCRLFVRTAGAVL
jgi:hypothetical protein